MAKPFGWFLGPVNFRYASISNPHDDRFMVGYIIYTIIPLHIMMVGFEFHIMVDIYIYYLIYIYTYDHGITL